MIWNRTLLKMYSVHIYTTPPTPLSYNTYYCRSLTVQFSVGERKPLPEHEKRPNQNALYYTILYRCIIIIIVGAKSGPSFLAHHWQELRSAEISAGSDQHDDIAFFFFQISSPCMTPDQAVQYVSTILYQTKKEQGQTKLAIEVCDGTELTSQQNGHLNFLFFRMP